MRTAFLAAFFVGLALVWSLGAGQATAAPFAEFSAERIHINVGNSMIVKVYVKNTNESMANISAWLVNYDSAKFAGGEDADFTPDMRNVTLQMNPWEESVLNLVVPSTSQSGNYFLYIKSNSSLAAGERQDSVRIYVDHVPNFPGLDWWGILAIIGLSGLAFWKMKK